MDFLSEFCCEKDAKCFRWPAMRLGSGWWNQKLAPLQRQVDDALGSYRRSWSNRDYRDAAARKRGSATVELGGHVLAWLYL